MLRRTLFACLTVVLMAGPAAASTFVAMETAELVSASGAVVQGEVLEVYSFWNRGGDAWVTVASSLSSNSSEAITFNGSSGYYAWRIYSWSGSGSYDFWLDRP